MASRHCGDVDVVITGGYDHPESERCELEVHDPQASPNLSPEEVVLICRAHFVVAKIVPAA